MTNEQQVRGLLLAYRRGQLRRDGTLPALNIPILELNWPAAIQASYARACVDHMQKLNKVFFGYVRPRLAGWISEHGARHRSDSSEDRADGYFLDLSILKDTLSGMLDGMFGTEAPLTVAIFGTGKKVNRTHKAQVKNIVEGVVRGSYFPREPWVDNTLNKWGEDNLELVQSLTQEYIVKMNEMVASSVTQGKTYRSIMDDLLNMAQGLSVNRAKLIAVDQIGKLYGALTKARFEEAGLNLYEWRTSQDERVRGAPGGKYPGAIPSHYLAHGMVCRWDRPDVYRPKGSKEWQARGTHLPMGIPGFPIRCRCHAKPIWDELLASVDKEILSMAA